MDGQIRARTPELEHVLAGLGHEPSVRFRPLRQKALRHGEAQLAALAGGQENPFETDQHAQRFAGAERSGTGHAAGVELRDLVSRKITAIGHGGFRGYRGRSRVRFPDGGGRVRVVERRVGKTVTERIHVFRRE